MRELLLSAVLVVLAMSGRVLASEKNWPEVAYNPSLATVDLALPLPCGGQMAFRKVETPTEANWLTDVRARFGRPSASAPYRDFVRQSNVVGGLTATNRNENDPAERFYYIGMYELTVPQVEALRGNCVSADEVPFLTPMDNLSWYDAVSLTALYNKYLLESYPERLESIGDDAAVRLPSEAEWEFAARGGVVVASDEDRRAPVFPLEAGESLQSYVHHFGRESCNGQAQPIGQLKPNPLGLFDMLGNVSELIIEPFRLNAHGRLHGQTGAALARGGSCLTYAEEISSALREEVPLVSHRQGMLLKPRFTGARLVISAPTQPTSERISSLKADFQLLADFSGRTVLDEKEKLAVAGISQPETREEVDSILAEYKLEIARRNRIEARSISSIIAAAALQIRAFRAAEDSYNRYLPLCEYSGDERWCANLEAFKETMRITRSLYSDLVFRMAEDSSTESLLAQQALVQQWMQAVGSKADFARLFVCHVERYRREPSDNIDVFFAEMLGVTVELSQCS